VSLADVTREDVLAAVAEFDKLGQEQFLERYGFGPARTYFLEYAGQRYDSKAIMGVAHGIGQGTYLRSEDFTGGEKTVVHHLRRLGFVTRTHRNPPWTWDEVVLACDLVRKNDWRWVQPNDPAVVEVSELLNLHTAHPIDERGEDFRNPNGVARKTADIATRHPEYKGKPTNGGQHDEKVLLAFLERPEEMEREAEAIREAIRGGLVDPTDVGDLDLEGYSAAEGRVLQQLHLRRERDPKLRAKAVGAYKQKNGKVACEACGFDFQQVYGKRGADYIECHHRTPLHVSGPTRTRLQDLIMLCSNCHRMVHRMSPWLTSEGLMAIIEQQRQPASATESPSGSPANY